MPVPWISANWTELAQAVTAQTTARQEVRVDGYLTIRYTSATYDPKRQVSVFENGVEATYDVTTIQCDRLEVHAAPGEEWALASGHVRVLDPDATMSAEDLRFCWLPTNRSGDARNVKIQVGHAHIEAARAQMLPTRWEFDDVRATNCPEYYWVRSPKVVVFPGSKGSIDHPTLYLFGRRIVSLPNRSFNLNPRTQGLSLPTVSYRSSQGVGVAWDAGMLLGDRTNVYGSGSAFPKSYPSLSLTATQSLLPANRITTILTPSSDFGERFRYGFLENVEVRHPADELRYLQTERSSISVDSSWNVGVTAPYDTFASKALEGVAEIGGPIGHPGNGFGYLSQIRYQKIRERDSPFIDRAEWMGSLELPSLAISNGLRTSERLDAELFGDSNAYRWARAAVGLIYEPNPRVQLGAGVFGATQGGQPDFEFDRPIGTSGVQLRANLDLGPTQLSVLTKYDRRLGWFDREYMVSQIAGCFEPFVLYRKFPSTYSFGVRLRLDDLYDILSRSEFQRAPGTTTVIDSPHVDKR